MAFISKNFKPGRNEYDFDALFNIEGAVRSIRIATAYTDLETIRKIFDIFRERYSGTGSTFSIYIDRYACEAPGDRE